MEAIREQDVKDRIKVLESELAKGYSYAIERFETKTRIDELKRVLALKLAGSEVKASQAYLESFNVTSEEIKEPADLKKPFYLDGWSGVGRGGLFVRNDLFKFFKTLREQGYRPVGIIVDDNYNMEIIAEEPDPDGG